MSYIYFAYSLSLIKKITKSITNNTRVKPTANTIIYKSRTLLENMFDFHKIHFTF